MLDMGGLPRKQTAQRDVFESRGKESEERMRVPLGFVGWLEMAEYDPQSRGGSLWLRYQSSAFLTQPGLWMSCMRNVSACARTQCRG